MQLSFAFTKIKEKNIHKYSHSDEEESEPVQIQEFDRNSDLEKTKQPKYVIPIIKKNKWVHSKTASKEEKPTSALEKQALDEIIRDSADFNSVENDNDECGSVIPLLAVNQPPPGTETADKIDFSIRPEAPSNDDYMNMPIKEFGMAMLLGMGFDKKKGIGKTFQQPVSVLEVDLRPKGMGLGADRKLVESLDKKKKGDCSQFVQGDKVEVTSGPHRNSVGVVLAVDGDLGRVLISFPNIDKPVSLSALLLVKFEPKTAKSNNGKRVNEPLSAIPIKRSKNYDHNVTSSAPSSSFWVRRDILVRIVETDFKHGRDLMGHKVHIRDINSINDITCETNSGKMLSVPQRCLETVVSRNIGSKHMVVCGKHAGRIATLVARDKKRESATIQFTDDCEIIDIDFDSLSEYHGDAD